MKLAYYARCYCNSNTCLLLHNIYYRSEWLNIIEGKENIIIHEDCHIWMW